MFKREFYYVTFLAARKHIFGSLIEVCLIRQCTAVTDELLVRHLEDASHRSTHSMPQVLEYSFVDLVLVNDNKLIGYAIFVDFTQVLFPSNWRDCIRRRMICICSCCIAEDMIAVKQIADCTSLFGKKAVRVGIGRTVRYGLPQDSYPVYDALTPS